MAENQAIKEAIQAVIQTMMDRVMNNVLPTASFVANDRNPFYTALVPEEIFRAARFERSFVTSFGSVWEKLAIIAAQQGLGYGHQSYAITGTVAQERLGRISEILNKLEHQDKAAKAAGESRIRPDWDAELAYVLKGSGEPIPVTVVCDVYAEDSKRNLRYAFELKAPKPNSDQTKVSKEKIFKLYAMEPRLIDGAYYALPYNPYGKREDYAWSFPARWFDMRKDEVVLIGDEFWEKIGGAGTYQAFIEAVNEIGVEYKERIYREYLGMEPPADLGSQL